jgi:DHA1 family tetracycline resistance protein-like MFS transporter
MSDFDLTPPSSESELPIPAGDLQPADSPAVPTVRRAAATFIFLTVALDMIALGMIAPVLPTLITNFLHGNASSAARMVGVFATVFAGIQFVCSPILGSLSDRFGRRPIVLLSNFGLGLDYVVMALAPTLPWLFVGRIVSGLTASSVPTAQAYMADVTPVEKRAAAFGMLGGAFGLGFILGPAVGGALGAINPRLPFWVAGSLSLINGCYGFFVLPESLSREHRSPFSWRRANPVGSANLLFRSKALIGMSIILTLGYIAQQSLQNVYVLYCDNRYHWSPFTVGVSLGVVGIFSALYSALLVKPAVKHLGERASMSIGLICGTIGWVMIGFSKTGILVWAAIPVMNLMAIVWPSAQAVMSREISRSEQGQLQGAINSIRGIGGLIGPTLFTTIYSATLFRQPGAAFFTAAAILLLSLAFSETLRPNKANALPK